MTTIPPDILEKIDSLSGEELRQYTLAARALAARLNDNPEGFSHFYAVIFGRELPEHALAWVRALYNAKAKKRGLVLWAFRGSTKTTTLTLAFMAFRIGHEPHKENLLVQVSDDIARDNTATLAQIIDQNPGWKLVFPHVVPDKDRGWGAGGYYVRRDDVQPAEWAQMVAERKMPSFVGMGYKSSSIIGKHPSGMLAVDDICDEKNTASARELQTVMAIVKGTLLPTITDETWVLFVGTPWVVGDVLDTLSATGEFDTMVTPVAVDENGRFKWPGGRPVWPERFPPEEIERRFNLSGADFARMFGCDIHAAEGKVLRVEWLHEFPAADISPTWPVYMGVDYASTTEAERRRGKSDFFCIAWGRAIPSGGCVVEGGLRERVTQAEAEARIIAMYNSLSPVLIGLEAVGAGLEFWKLISRLPGVPVMPMKPGNKSKAERFEREMAPLFVSGRIYLSSASNSFLDHFRAEWAAWPYGEHDDTLDAVYWFARACQSYLYRRPEADTLPAEPEALASSGGPKKSNPFAALGGGR